MSRNANTLGTQTSGQKDGKMDETKKQSNAFNYKCRAPGEDMMRVFVNAYLQKIGYSHPTAFSRGQQIQQRGNNTRKCRCSKENRMTSPP
jgi:hypothetical protein